MKRHKYVESKTTLSHWRTNIAKISFVRLGQKVQCAPSRAGTRVNERDVHAASTRVRTQVRGRPRHRSPCRRHLTWTLTWKLGDKNSATPSDCVEDKVSEHT